MSIATVEDFGLVTDPGTIVIKRVVPGPVDRVWDYLTKNDLRRQWLAAGDMELRVGAPVELVWDFQKTTADPGPKPDVIPNEFRLQSEVLVCEPHRRLALAWGLKGKATFLLKPMDGLVELTVTHEDIPSRDAMVWVAASWCSQFDVLKALLQGKPIDGFWHIWQAYSTGHDKYLPVAA